MRLGFIGLGVMGGHMARHLSGEHGLIVFDVDRAKVDAVAAAMKRCLVGSNRYSRSSANRSSELATPAPVE